MKYSVYQAPVTAAFVFMNYRFAVQKLQDFPLNWKGEYKQVFEGELHTGDNDFVVLEHLFDVLNNTHPEGYKGRSLSVSDVVVLEDEDGCRTYYCDSLGWQEV